MDREPSEETVELHRPQCGRILTDRTKGKRGIAGSCGRPPYTKRASHKKCSAFRLFTLGEWRILGRTERGRKYGQQDSAGKLGGIPGYGQTFALLVSGSFLLCSPLPGTLYHLQLLSDRNSVRVLLGHCNLGPASWITCNLDPDWVNSLVSL